jgi:hypothetical protein
VRFGGRRCVPKQPDLRRRLLCFTEMLLLLLLLRHTGLHR